MATNRKKIKILLNRRQQIKMIATHLNILAIRINVNVLIYQLICKDFQIGLK